MNQEIRLMIVDFNHFFRECLAHVLNEHEGLIVVSLSGDAEDAMVKLRANNPDLVLVNFHLPDNSAFSLISRISTEMPDIKVVAFGMDDSGQTIRACVEAGSSGYILNNASVSDLIKVVQAVHQGETVCSPQVAYSMFERVKELSRSLHNWRTMVSCDLTTRELEVLELVTEGLNNRQIADHLFVSRHTIKSHIHNILDKTQVRNRSELVRFAMEKRLVQPQYRSTG